MGGVVLVVQIGQLVPQIISSNFPVAYMNIRVVSWIYYLCLALEQTGVCYTVWLICWCIHKCLGTEEENVVDLSDKFEYLTNSDSETRMRILKNLQNLKEELNLESEQEESQDNAIDVKAMEHT